VLKETFTAGRRQVLKSTGLAAISFASAVFGMGAPRVSGYLSRIELSGRRRLRGIEEGTNR